MAYGNNDTEYEAGAPKKADVLIRSTQHIAVKQDELSEQTRQIALRLDEALEQFSQNSQDSSYIVKQSGEIFSQIQTENSALKQELLYLAKQSENIYAGLAEKITDLSDRSKNSDAALSSLADRINEVSEQAVKSGEVYSSIIDKLAELTEQNKRNEKLFCELSEKLEAISEHTKKNEKAYGELSDKIVVSDKNEQTDIGSSQLLDKINYISDQLRRSEGAHSMLADKFEILSMRVEQFGFESAKGAPRTAVAPVAYPVPAQTEVKAEIDYDKLAEKIADLVSAREAVSPDYIASKVAEQVVIPEVQTANVKVSVDTHDIARQVAELIDGRVVNVTSSAPANVNLDEEGLADRIAQKLGDRAQELAPAAAVADIDEEELAERIARKVGGMRSADVSSVPANVNIDEDELADNIALKVGSLKAEDFEILVDDEGCTSISKEIADNLDYNAISNIIADKLRDALDLASVNAPDYEEMAERISEKITVAGINEAAIADKAAAALSNYLPEIDTDEIADKVTGAVIDVVSAMPQPSVDSEAICNAISEKLIASQEDHDYDIVIDDEGISKITEIVTQEIENGTASRFDKVEEEIAKLGELLAKTETAEENISEQATEEEVEEVEEVEEKPVQFAEPDYFKLSELVSAEIEKGTASRFDKVEDDIAKLTELVSGAVTEEEVEEGYGEEEAEEDYSALSEVVAGEIEKGIEGVVTRISGIEENVAKITEYLTAEVEEEQDEEYGEEAAEDAEEEAEVEEDYTALSEVVAAEIEKGVSSRLTAIEENVAKITEYLTEEPEEEAEETEEEQEEDYGGEEQEEIAEEEYTALSEVVAGEIEKGIEGVTTRLTALEENVTKVSESIASISEHINSEQVRTARGIVSRIAELEEHVTSEQVRTAKGIVSRIVAAEENITKAIDAVEAKSADGQVEVVEDYSALSGIVATEIERGISFRLDGVEEDIAKLCELLENNTKTENGDEDLIDKVCVDIAEIKEMLSNGATVVSETAAVQSAEPIEVQEPFDGEELVTVSGVVDADEDEQPEEQVEEQPVAEQPAQAEPIIEQVKQAEPVERTEPVKEKETIREVKEYVKEKETLIILPSGNGQPINNQPVSEQPMAEPAKQPIDIDVEEYEEFEEDEEEEDDDDDFTMDVLDMDEFSDDELMPGELSDYADGVDFANMMKFKRSFIARIIQSNDENKQYYGEVKHALLSYKKVNSNVAWGAERFNKGRETIARMKIRGKTLCLYLALDPNDYKTSVYHHLDLSDNKSVAGTPMMVKVKSNLGVRKAIRLINEMLAKRNGERKEIPERDYAAMYPYETIEELIEEGLVKDVRKK